jgi:CRP-like cAMP-binding protein
MSGLGSAIEQFAAMRVERTPGDDPNKVWYLRQNRLFAEATDAEVSGSQGIFTMCEMPRGTRVFDLGDTTRVVYLVKRGAVRIARETPDGKDVTVALLSRDPSLALNVAKLLSERLDDARATMEDLAYARVGDRIVHLYRKLALEHGVAVEGGTRVELRLTHADVASLVGSTRETVSVEIAKLVETGRLRLSKRAVIVPTEETT